MSTTKLQKFIVYAPDKTEEGTHDRRLAVREEHIANAQALINAGSLDLGAVMLTPESVESEANGVKMVGSVLIFEAKTIADVEMTVKSDIYYTSGVWDLERIVILPINIGLKSERILH